ncbi:MAG: PIN domain-containing protein [Candidatus Heimdallarchaeota archaeon]|nr:PIN domain-containing protein [Candidatus Heimdallarchaeota archaeon]
MILNAKNDCFGNDFLMFLFDTDFLIDLTNSHEGAISFTQKIDQTPVYKAISVITVQEYLRGVYYLYRNSSTLSVKLSQAEEELSRFDILPIDYSIAKLAAEIDAFLMKKGRMISSGDVVIELFIF